MIPRLPKFESAAPEHSFLPAVIEIEETPPSPLGRAVLWSIVGLLAVALLWASLGHVDIVAVAPGKLVPSGQVKILQSPAAGTVKAIHVMDGQRVQIGQVLIELDPTIAQADLNRVTAEYEAARQELARYRAFVAAIDPARSNTSSQADLAASQRSALSEATSLHRSRLRQVDQAIERRRADLRALTEQADKLRRTLPLITERANSVGRLAATGLVARHTALEIEQQRIEIEQDLAAAEASMQATEAAVQELIEERRTVQADAVREALDRVAELETAVASLEQQHVKAEHLAADTSLRAPVDGQVQQLALHTIGGVVQPGETLLVVVPEGPALEVEALVLNKDIGFIRAGQQAAVKLDAFPFTRYGALQGVISGVSEDAVDHETLGPVYPVRLAIATNDIRVDGRSVRLSSGMAASAEVRTGERRIIDFLLSPIARGSNESLRER